MLNFTKKLKKNEASSSTKRVSIRDRLLVKDVQEMEQNMPSTCKANFPDPDVLCQFTITVIPDEGFWKGGRFKFNVEIPEDYNMAPPIVKCSTKVFHPNIKQNSVCLSMLRLGSSVTDNGALGWSPTRALKDVVWALNSLFTDLLNFEDPLNPDAARMYKRNEDEFQRTVRTYIDRYARG